MQIDLLDQQLAANLRGDFEEGWRIAQILEKERPTDHRAAFNRGWHMLRMGDLQMGMELLDRGRIAEVFGSRPLPKEAPPQWDGKTDIKGKTVLLYGEGGLGDEMINARFAKSLGKRGARVILSCHPSLASLLERVEGVAATIPRTATSSTRFDYWVPAMSAARWLSCTYATLPNERYLSADPSKVSQWAGKISGNGLKVGIRWGGNQKFEHEQHRRFPPEPLFDLRKIPGVKLYSLQRDSDIRDLPEDVTDLQFALSTWEDTAAAIANLDLVITSCTAVAHCAAALGKETWVILPILPYYIWAYPGERSPWYKTARLFRQERYGDWTGILKRVNEELQKKATGGGDTQVTAAKDATASTSPTPVVGGVPPQASFEPQLSTPPDFPYVLFAPKPKPKAGGNKKEGNATLHFVAGLPRSGSTALMNLLAQNSRIFAAPISGMCGIFSGIFANWDKNEFHKEMPNPDARRRVLRAVLDNYHGTDRPVILDKDRMWVLHMARLEELLERPIKMIIPVRAIPEILTAFELLRKKDPLQLTGADDSIGPGSTLSARAAYFSGDGGPLGMAYNAMKDSVTGGYLDRMLFVDYNKLMDAPKMQLKRIYEFLEEPYFEHDFTLVKQIAHGDARSHGFPGLHDIRSEFKKISRSPREMLGADLYAKYDQPEPWAMWT